MDIASDITENILSTAEILLPFLWLVAALVTGFAFEHVMNPLLIKGAKKAGNRYIEITFASFEKPTRSAIILFGAFSTFLFFPLSAAHRADFTPLATTLLRIGLILLLTQGMLGLRRAIPLLLHKATDTEEDDNNRLVISHFFSATYKVIVFSFCTMMIVTELGYNVSSLVAGLGLGGLTVALAAKDSAANFFGGIVLLFEKPFKIGDWISAGEIEGTVENITYRSTHIRTINDAVSIVPNAKLCEQSITNWSLLHKRLAKFTLQLTYSTPTQTLENVVSDVRQMLRADPEVLPETVEVQLDEFSTNSLDISVLFYANTTKISDFRAAKGRINLAVLKIVQKRGASFALPSQSVYFKTPLTLAQPDPANNNAK